MEKITILIAGLSSTPDKGKMARLVAEAIASQKDMSLYPFALSEERGDLRFGSVDVHAVPIGNHTDVLERCSKAVDVIVDFTQPNSVNRNAELYCEAGIPFVMGTTGGDRQELERTVRESDISAVIAPNMAIPIVVFMAMIRSAAQNFPRSFEGFKLVISESHQASKPDPSGTAVSLLDSFAALGMPLKKEQIIMVRDRGVQMSEMGIPKQYLGGHGYHTYTMLSSDGTVMLQFKHNVLGRNVYVDGALRAIRFIAKVGRQPGLFFSMADVLK